MNLIAGSIIITGIVVYFVTTIDELLVGRTDIIEEEEDIMSFLFNEINLNFEIKLRLSHSLKKLQTLK